MYRLSAKPRRSIEREDKLPISIGYDTNKEPGSNQGGLTGLHNLGNTVRRRIVLHSIET
jgi:hypothetical protein